MKLFCSSTVYKSYVLTLPKLIGHSMHRSSCLPFSEVACFAILKFYDLDESAHVIIQEYVQLQENCSNTFTLWDMQVWCASSFLCKPKPSLQSVPLELNPFILYGSHSLTEWWKNSVINLIVDNGAWPFTLGISVSMT